MTRVRAVYDLAAIDSGIRRIWLFLPSPIRLGGPPSGSFAFSSVSSLF